MAPRRSSPETQPVPVLLGTIVGEPTTAAIFEYQGGQRVVKEGGHIGPYTVGGIYKHKASLRAGKTKTFVFLKPQKPIADFSGAASGFAASSSPTGAPGLAGGPGGAGGLGAAGAPQSRAADRWLASLRIIQVMRNNAGVGLLVQTQDGSSPFREYGMTESDVLTAVNKRPVRAQSDLWWVYQELEHAPRIEMAIERGGQAQVLCQDRSLARAR